VLVLERPDAIFPAEPRKESAFIERRLRIQIELSGPPSRGSVFKLGPKGVKVIAGALSPEGRKILNLKISRFFEIVVLRDYVRTLLARDAWSHKGE
jgi:hypothetical protein